MYSFSSARRMRSSLHRQLSHLFVFWKRSADVCLFPAAGFYCCKACSTSVEPDPTEFHKRKLFLWFSHLPQEEKQFGGYFSPETMHVDPLILERKPEEKAGLLGSLLKNQASSGPSITVEQLFEISRDQPEDRGLNVLLYGAVGTGKSTVVRKLVLDWCAGTTLTDFKLLIPFSCEDLGELTKVASLRDLVSRKYLHLKKNPLLSGEGNQAKDVLFLFNGMEKMKLDFRIGSTELCSDPNEPLPAGAVVVNLLRKYLLPEASVLVTTRLSALDRIPPKYVSRYAQICGFNDQNRQRAYFTSRLLQQSGRTVQAHDAQALIELLYLNLQRESQLASACFLPSYCWLTCATLHFLHFTDAMAPIRTLTGIYTSFLRLNFGGEVLGKATGASGPTQDLHSSLMFYVVRTVGKLAYEGVTYKRTSFSEQELEQWIGGKTKTDEELRQLAVFRTDVLDFFLAPCVESCKHLPTELCEHDESRYVFAVPAMQEYLAALYVVLGENKSALEKLTKQVSVAIGQATEDVSAVVNIFSKFIPLRIFAAFNLLKLFPKLYEKISSRKKGNIARTMAAELFRKEDSYNEDVLDQVEQSLLGVHGPPSQQQSEVQPFELYPIFMGGLLHYGNRVLLQQLGCSIQSTTVAQITRALRKYLVREINKPQPPEELMDLLVLLYEFQNPRLTAEVLASIRTICLHNIRMTTLKCFVLSSVLSCAPPRFKVLLQDPGQDCSSSTTTESYQLEELDLSSCLLTQSMLQMLLAAFRHTRNINLQFNSLGPDSCIFLRDLLLDSKGCVRALQLCDNPLLDSGMCLLLEAIPQNQTLRHLSLMHTGLGDEGALKLAEKLQQLSGLLELNVAYNNIGDNAALALVDVCREHPSIHTVHLYLNPLSEVGKQSLYVRGSAKSQSSSGQRVRVLAAVTEGSDLSEDWHPILSVIRENASSWDRERVKQQLKVFLRDLEWGRQQQQSLLKKLHFRRVEKGVRQTLQMLEKDMPPPFA
ncbi:NLR family member X1 isoform X2 [Syngnathoides biaculeatus]|uniref:NLR family member X1 isoform X2 n=1 Tax=Syngnathoides biaculeatus TaxID=300417 RepID=UPI002ADD36A3|nr:NLR family member X1 isoform X2 [Syngnathoides biaculeatus]